MAGLSRPQVIVLLAGLAQLATAVLGFPDLGEPHRVLLMCTGLAGLACLGSRRRCRLYGAGLAIGYGAIAYAGIAEEVLVLHLRAVLVGVVITVVPAGRGPVKGEVG